MLYAKTRTIAIKTDKIIVSKYEIRFKESALSSSHTDRKKSDTYGEPRIEG